MNSEFSVHNNENKLSILGRLLWMEICLQGILLEE